MPCWDVDGNEFIEYGMGLASSYPRTCLRTRFGSRYTVRCSSELTLHGLQQIEVEAC